MGVSASLVAVTTGRAERDAEAGISALDRGC